MHCSPLWKTWQKCQFNRNSKTKIKKGQFWSWPKNSSSQIIWKGSKYYILEILAQYYYFSANFGGVQITDPNASRVNFVL